MLRSSDGADEIVVETHLHVREDALQLAQPPTHGATALRAAPRRLRRGPEGGARHRLGYSPAELNRAIIREDAACFQTIPGIGKKTAQRVVLELKERIAPLAAVEEAPHLGAGDGHIVARDALVGSAIPTAEAEQRLAETDPDAVSGGAGAPGAEGRLSACAMFVERILGRARLRACLPRKAGCSRPGLAYVDSGSTSGSIAASS